MTRFTKLLLAAVLLPTAMLPGACAIDPLPDAAHRIDPASLGSNQDAETVAINTASWSLAEPSRTRNNPIQAARALASVDFLAGDLYASPRWNGLNPLWKLEMLNARVESRKALGIAPGTGSQQVVDALLDAANAMSAQRPDLTEKVLTQPLFTFGPQRTFALLQNLPPLPTTNIATAHLEAAFSSTRGQDCVNCD